MVKKKPTVKWCPLLMIANNGRWTPCIEKECAWWTLTYNDCAIKDIAEVLAART